MCMPACRACDAAEQAKVSVLSLDSATLRQAAVVLTSADNDTGPSSSMQLDIGAVAATADADALLCLVAVADSAAQQLAPVLAAAAPRGGSGSGGGGRPRKQKQQQQGQQRRGLSISLGYLRFEQPMCAERDMALEIDAVRAVVGAQQGCLHSLATGVATLTMHGKAVLRWRQLAVALQLPAADGAAGGACRLVAPSLPRLPAGAGTAKQRPASAAAEGAVSGGEAGREAYQRARLEAWLDLHAATAPAGGSSAADNGSDGGVAASALGAGPASILDASIR